MQALRYVLLSLALGGLSVWGSENFFWMMPPAGITPPDFLATLLAYSVAAAVALSAVIWSGIGGFPAAFLGGAIVGYMSEGVIVGTIYQPMPPLFYVIWTPLAWHALITGGVLLGLGRAAAVLGPGRMALIWAVFGLAGSYWAQFWVSEREGIPALWLFAGYIAGLGLLVPLAHVVMDRIGQMPRPQAPVLWVAPAMALLVWVAQGLADPNPMRVILPLVLGLVLWVMRRLGQRAAPVSLGRPVPVWQHLLFLIAPAIVVILAPLGWAQGWGTLGANGVVAAVGCCVSVLWLGRLTWSAAKRKQRG